MGPFDNWPTGSGFEYFYGFIGGEAHQYYPALYEGTTPVEPRGTPEEGYHLMGDMTDKAIDWVRQQKSLMPDKPFFAYFAPGATHAPHHVPKEWADKYAGQFDDGWDALRERIFARQKELGVIPRRRRAHARATTRSRPGTTCRRSSSRCCAARWRSTPASWSSPTTTSGRLLDALEDLEVSRQHARLLHHRRQRRLGRGHAERHVQRDDQLQRRRRARDAGVHDRAPRRVRRAGLLQPLRGRLGARDGHAVPVDQAGRLALRRHPQRHDRALARRLRRRRARSGPSSRT